MVSPQALRSVDQFLKTETTDQGLVARFSLPAAMLAHCPDHSNATYTLNLQQLDQKITDTIIGGLRPEKKEAQLEQFQYAIQKLKM